MFNLFFVFLSMSIFSNCKSLRGLSSDKFTDAFSHRIVIGSRKLPERKIDENYKIILESFLKDARDNGVIIKPESIKKLRRVEKVDEFSVPSGPGVIASCNRYVVGENVIDNFSVAVLPVQYMTIEVLKKALEDHARVDENTNQIHPEKEKEVLYHELFHCLLNKGHLPPGEEGIMAPSISRTSRRVFKEWDRLVEEMFSPKYLNLIPDT